MIIASSPIIAATMPMIVPVEPRFMEAAGRTDQDFVEEKMDEREEMVKRGSYCAHVA